MAKRVAGLLLTLFLLSAGVARAQIRSGSYSGSGSPRSITGLGFQPDVVILKGNDNTIRAIGRTSTMSLSKGMVSAVAAASGLITSLDPDGFSLSGDVQVNKLAVAYHWVAFRMEAGESKVGTYTGTGADNFDITGLGFLPAYVVVIPTSARPVYHRSSSMTGDDSFDFDNSFGDPNRIQALLADGFQVGSDPDVNDSGFTYNYVAWKAIPGKMAVGSYVGDGLDNRSITGAGMRPEYVIVKRDGTAASNGASQKPLSTGAATDQSLLFNMSNFQVDAIQALESDGFQVGTQPRVNLASDTYYWMAFADECPPLTTSEGASTVTVTAPGGFEMRFNAARGGSLDEFFDLAEDPSRTLDLAGKDSINLFGLFHSSMTAGGLLYATGTNSSGAKLDLLEATATRVKVRQEAFYQRVPPATAILAGVKGIGDYSVYGPRLAIGWSRKTTAAVGDQDDHALEMAVRREAAGVLNPMSLFSQSGSVFPALAGDDFVLAQREVAGAPGVRTDFLAIQNTDWPAADALTVSTTGAFFSWRDNTLDQNLLPGLDEKWRFLVYYKPTNFVDNLDPAVTGRSADYRSASAITVGPGTQWQDAAENTAAAADFFNEAEAAYVFDFDPATGLSFDVDGSSTTRYAPFFKIRQWRSLRPPATVTLEGVGLVRDADYRADVKPVSRSSFVNALSWHCTFESTTACTPGTGLDVGSAGSADFVGAILPGRYGNAADFTAEMDSATAGTAGSGDFSAVIGAVEFWYQPHYNHDDNARHLIWFNQSGAATDFHCFILEKNGLNELRFSVLVNYADTGCTMPDVNSTNQFLAAPATGYGWRADDWVHIKTTWDAGGGPKKLRLFVEGLELAFSGTYTAPSSHGPTVFGGCSGFMLCPGGINGHANGLIDEPHIYTGLDGATGETALSIAHAGLLADSSEYLSDTGRNFQIGLSPVNAFFHGTYLYIGSDAKFHGLNVDLLTPGTGANPGGLQWEYWDGTKWTSREGGGFTDTTNSLLQNGRLHWTTDPVPWLPYSVDGGPDLYYVRVYLVGTPYSSFPSERQIKTDILLFQYCGDVTAAAQTFAFPPPGSADLSVTKTDGQATEVPGTPVSYTITVTNNGPDTVTSLFVNDPVPAAILSPTFTPSTGTYNVVTGEWTGLSLAATQSVTLMLSGTIDPFARVSLANTATVSPPPGVMDPNGINDFFSDTDTLDASADVRIVKLDDVDPAPLGGLLTYTLTVTNDGPSGATSVDVTDALPADMELDTAPGAITWSQGSCSYVALTRTVSCMLGNLAPAGVATVTIKVRPGAVRSFDNTASVLHGELDPVAVNDSESETTQVVLSSTDVRFFTATSTNQRNVLEWVNPTDADYVSTAVVWRTDRFPTGPLDGTTLFSGGVSGGREKKAHDTPALTNGQAYYYGAFVNRSMPPVVSPGRFMTGRPFDHTTGPVKWAFSTGATALAAPTVGGAGVIATSNDRIVYAMERGTDDDQLGIDSGEWPASFAPIELGGPVQLRSPVIPITVNTSNPVAYLGAQDGKVYAVDAAKGGSVVSPPWVGGPTMVGSMLQAAPAGIFTAFGSTLNYLLLGTRDSSGPNVFVALNPISGAVVDSYNNGVSEIGIVNGMAAVDYGPPLPPRVYFTSYTRVSTNTLWCFQLSSAAPVFSLLWARPLGNIDSSPVLRNGRVYVGSPAGGGTVYSIDALTGASGLDRTFVHGNGQVKGFVFPDRASNDIYFATDDFVWGVTDTGAATMPNKFAGPISLPGGAKPSPVLFVPGSHYVYVGGSDGKLHEIDVLPAVPVLKQVTLGNGLAVVGAPSLDRVYSLVHVGTEAGIFYAVQVPLP